MRRVRAGSSTRFADGDIVDIASVVTHPSYGDTVENFFAADIAVVRLGNFLTFGPTIQQTPIVTPGFNLAGGLPIKLVGWGSTAVSIFRFEISQQLFRKKNLRFNIF